MLLREVLPFAAATVVAAVYFRASLIVLGLVSSEAQTGYFGAAFRVTEVLLPSRICSSARRSRSSPARRATTDAGSRTASTGCSRPRSSSAD